MNLRSIGWKMAAAVAVMVNLQAHPGHAPFSEGVKHFATSPNHFGPPLVFALILCVAAQLLQRRGERNFVRGIAAAITLLAVLS